MQRFKHAWSAKTATLAALIAVIAVLGFDAPQPASAIGAGDADTAIGAFNNAFLVISADSAYYKSSLSKSAEDGTWTASLDIMGEEDAYERTGSAADRALVNNLCATWLKNTPPPWTWDGWNDDIGWFSLALIRGYQITGNPAFLTQAEYGFNIAYNRGWDTQYNGGGIWEQQPNMTPAGQGINKAALSNDSLGKVACMLYQSTHDVAYLNKAQRIYDWVRTHIYNSSTGEVDADIDRKGVVDTGSAVYNQGTFVDYANLLYQITRNVNYYNDAVRSISYVRDNMTTGGIISNSAGYLNTWADEFARGLGHFVRDSNQWSAYYPWMVQNANAAWGCRRTDHNIAWNGWTQQTPMNNSLPTSQFVSAVAWLQYTPAMQPNGAGGVHAIFTYPLSSGLRLMPVGDSITSGYRSSTGNGYRGPLWDELIKQGDAVDFVGSQRSGVMFDPDNEGHSGYRIDQIAGLIDKELALYQPNLVLLDIGTNDLGQNYQVSTAPARLASLIDQIVAADPNATILVAPLICNSTPRVQTLINSFNAQIPAIVQARTNAGKRVSLVSMSALTTDDLKDGLHPNDTGYQKMADAWDVGIKRVIAAGNLTRIDFAGKFEIQSVNSGLALDVSGGSTANNAAIIQQPHSADTGQLWNFIPTDSGYYQIKNAPSGLDLNVTAASTTNGATIVQWQFGTQGNDQWFPMQNLDGSYVFYNRNSGLLLDNPGDKTQGAQMDQWGANGGANQKFRLIAH